LEAQAFEVVANSGFQFRGFRKLSVQFGGEFLYFLVEGFAVILDVLCSDIATRREDMAVGDDFREAGGLAEAGGV